MKFLLGFILFIFVLIFSACSYALVMGIGSMGWAIGIGIISLFVIVCSMDDVIKLAKGIV